MNAKKSILLAAVGLVMACGAATGASAQTPWQADHPRRAEVNERLNNQDVRIDRERRDGEIGAVRAHRLHREDWRIRHRERRFARFHHGHISRFEQHRLNREENRSSGQIGR